MNAPPIASEGVNVPAPSSTADTEANSTSVIITTAVTLAGSRDAPYCSARLPARNAAPKARAPSTQSHCGSGGGVIWPWLDSDKASSSATRQPPANMASARAAPGWSASRRSITLFRANVKPPITPSHSGNVCGSGSCSARPPCKSAAGHNTTTAPASAIATRSRAIRVKGSCNSNRASSTAHKGIR